MSEQKKSIYYKIINFFKNLFKNQKDDNLLLNEATNNVYDNPKSDFIDNLKVNKKEDESLLELQYRFEKNDIDLLSISSEEINNLDKLYDRQIQELENKLNDKKINLAIKKRNINNV